MLDSFLATLEERDLSFARMCSYRLEAGTDLLGARLVGCGLRPHRRPRPTHLLYAA
ncbi:MAG: hypothetical protein JO189_22275 [Deltaproteobacteria bacterium]|nr:hypothetical protein [Deltaproteobacteria bacterium]